MLDEVAALSVEGVSKSAIPRLKGLAWNTVDRWLEKAAESCEGFSHRRIQNLHLRETQLDEIRAFTGRKERPTWIFTAIGVWSRLWATVLVGRRSYRNTRDVLRRVRGRMKRGFAPFIVTDGFEYYARCVREVFGPTSIYGQPLKTRRNDRVIKVERKQVYGPKWKFEEALANSEDSSTMNTSFVERLNLTIRQGSAYLGRRTLAHARSPERLAQHLELLRFYYNFSRPHRTLKFRKEMRTPAMQAELAKRKVSFREVFSLRLFPLPRAKIVCQFPTLSAWRSRAA